MKGRKYTAGWLTTLLVTTSAAIAPASSLAGEVVTDDLVIDGSVCIGSACVENMEFAFSTIQFQGENLQLQLDDPRRGRTFKDWAIIANDSKKYGENYLGFAQVDRRKQTVIFRIKAGADADSLVVNSEGKLGVGTASPAEQLHVVGDAVITRNVQTDALEQSSSRTLKHDIEDLLPGAALAAVADLQPVSYRLKAQPDDSTLGFIAEHVPDLLASPGRMSIEPMKFVAALTGAVQAQGKAIDVRQRETAELEARLERLEQALLARSSRAAH